MAKNQVMERVNLEKIISKAEELGASEVEVILMNTRSREIMGVKDRIDWIIQSDIVRIGFRVVIGKRVAYYGSEVSSYEDAIKALEIAIKVAKVMNEDRYWHSLPSKLGKGGNVPIYDDKIVKLSTDEASSLVFDGLKMLSSKSPIIEPVGLGLDMSEVEYVIANSYGGLMERLGTLATLYVEARSRDSGKEGTYSDYVVSRSLEGLKFHELISRVKERVIDALRAKPIKTKRMDLVFEPKVFAGIIMASFLPAITADNVQANRSPLKGRVSKQVFNERVTMIDDPFKPFFYGSKPFDDEGIATRVKSIINNGILETFLYDHYTARKESKESTGNAWRDSPSSRPRPWATNLILNEGNASIEEIISECRECLLISKTIGQWLSNPVSGQVNATLTHGYLIKNGKIIDVVKGVTISGNIYDMLGKNLDVIGKGLECYMNVCSPIVKISNVIIAGKE